MTARLIHDRRIQIGAGALVPLLAWQAPWVLVIFAFLALCAAAIWWTGLLERGPRAKKNVVTARLLHDRRAQIGAGVLLPLLAWQAPWVLVLFGFLALCAVAIWWTGLLEREPRGDEFEDWF